MKEANKDELGLGRSNRFRLSIFLLMGTKRRKRRKRRTIMGRRRNRNTRMGRIRGSR